MERYAGSLVQVETWDTMQRVLETSHPVKRQTILNHMEELVQTVQNITSPTSTGGSTLPSPLTSPYPSARSSGLHDPVSPTGILEGFKQASNKIADLRHKASPCKKSCSYHSQRPSINTTTQVPQISSEVPRNQRLTLPPLLDCSAVPTLVHSQPQVTSASLVEPAEHSPQMSHHISSVRPVSLKSSSVINCTPLLFKRPATVRPMSGTFQGQALDPDAKSFIRSKWQATFLKPDVHQRNKRVKALDQSPSSHPLHPSSDILTAPTSSASNQTPLHSSTPASLWRPYLKTKRGYPSSSIIQPDSPTSRFYSIVTNGSCRDPEDIRQRTINASILVMNESEGGTNDFSEEHWDSRDTGPAKSSAIPLELNTLEAVPDSDKRKSVSNNYKQLPLKKRFSTNFNSDTFLQQLTCQPQKKSLPRPQVFKKSGKKSWKGNSFIIEGTNRTSRAREPLESLSLQEQIIVHLEEILTAFMASKMTSRTLLMESSKQKLLVDYARLCYITAVRTVGGVKLRKTSSSRAPIPLDKEWMMS